MADDASALLVRAGLITAEHLAAARTAQQQDGGTVGEHLVVKGLVSDEKLTEFYRTRLLVPQVHPNTLARLSPSIVGLLPADLAAELRAVPVALDKDGNLTVAMSDPSDRHAVDEIGFFTGKYVVRAVATQMQIAWCLAQYYDCLTELGERLLQPAAPAAAPTTPAPAPAPVPDTIKPLVARGGDTKRIEATRHKVLAPVTTPPPASAQRPTGAALDRSKPELTPPAPAPVAPAPAPVAPAPTTAVPTASPSATTLVPATAPTPAAPAVAETKPAPAPLPRGAFGGDTPDTPVPPPSAWQAPAVAAAPPATATAEAAPAGDTGVPDAADQNFDDTPSIIISYELSEPIPKRVVRPDPPELAARSGELRMIELANRVFEAPTATIEINFGDDEAETTTASATPEPIAAETEAETETEAEAEGTPTDATAAAPEAAHEVPAASANEITAPMSAPVERPRPSSPIPIKAPPEAPTTKVASPVLAVIAHDGPPSMPAANADAAPEPAPDADADAAPAADADAAPEPAPDAAPALATAAAATPARAKPSAAVVDEVEDEADDAPILLVTPRRSGELAATEPPPSARPQAVVVESIDDASGPLLLTDRMRRREARRREKGTMIGIGDLGPIPRSVEPTPTPYAAPTHAPPTRPPPERHTTVPEAFDDAATVRAKLRFDEHDALDDGWGPPGTTIPPGFLGAVPAEIHDRPSEPAPAPAGARAAVPASPLKRESTAPLHSRSGASTGKPPAPLPAIPPPRHTPPGARPAATLTPQNRNRTVAGVPDSGHLAELLEQASQRLVELLHGFDAAAHRDHVIALLVDFVAESHHRVAFLALKADELTPFMQIPEPAGGYARLDLRHAATFQDVIGTRLPYRGPISDGPSRELVRALFGSATDEMLLVPVAVRDRVVGVIYADGRHRHSFDEHVTVAGRAAGLALERILKDRKS